LWVANFILVVDDHNLSSFENERELFFQRYQYNVAVIQKHHFHDLLDNSDDSNIFEFLGAYVNLEDTLATQAVVHSYRQSCPN
jgi:hypothetical protein